MELYSFFYILYSEKANNKLSISQKKIQWENAIFQLQGLQWLCFHSFSDPLLCLDPIGLRESIEEIFFDETLKDRIDFQSDSDAWNYLEAPVSCIDLNDFQNLLYFVKSFLTYTIYFFDLVNFNFTIQSNEFLDAMNAKFAKKQTNWNSSFEIRIANTIVIHKIGHIYFLVICCKTISSRKKGWLFLCCTIINIEIQ